MKRTSIRRAALPGIAVLGLAVSVSACAAGNESNSSGSSSGSLSGTLNGGGSSAQESAMSAWRAGFQSQNGDGVTVNYDPVGSGTGRANFISGAYMFAGSDAALSTDAGELDKAKQRCGGDVIEIPDYVSPIAVVYNLDGVDNLQLSPETLADIFAGKITKWNDPAIAKDNPDAQLPSTRITPVHRSDDSGTTENFTDYLNQASNGHWKWAKDGVWPIKGGESGEGTSGLVAAVKAGQGTIGYADESQAGSLGQAAIKVGSTYNKPSAEGAAKVLAVSPRTQGRGKNDMAIDVDRTTTESGAYPIMLTSYLLACPTYDNANDAALVKGLLSYIVSDAGQQAAAKQAGSAPLDSKLAGQAKSIVDQISGK